MLYNKEALLALPDDEKVMLAEVLWESITQKTALISEEDILFAEKRLQMHEASPAEGIEIEELKKKVYEKYGF